MDNKHKNIIPKGTFIFCIIAGIVLILFATYLTVGTNINSKDYYKIDAIVSDVGNDGQVYVNYTYSDKKYTNIPISRIMSTPSTGDSLEIYINSTDYTDATTDQFNRYIAKIIYICGGIFLGVGIICMIIRRLIMGKHDAIIDAGKYTYVDVTKVVYESSISDEEGRHPFTLYCHYEDITGKHHHDYVIENVYTNPNRYLEANNNKLKIYIKGKNYKKYRFDESVLTEN